MASVFSRFCVSSSSIFQRRSFGSITEIGEAEIGSSDVESSTKEEGLSCELCAEEFDSESVSVIPYPPIMAVRSATAGLLGRDFSAVRATLAHCGGHTITQASRGEIQSA
jgi:hypothetical protein